VIFVIEPFIISRYHNELTWELLLNFRSQHELIVVANILSTANKDQGRLAFYPYTLMATLVIDSDSIVHIVI